MKKRKIKNVVSIAFFVFFFTLGVTTFYHFAEQEEVATAQMRNPCVACHVNIGKDKFVHGPIAVGDCMICHVGDAVRHMESPARNRFAPIKDVGALCYKCHDRLDTKKEVHKPVKEGDCLKCHDPHQSSYRYLVRKEGQDLCFMCHDKKIADGKFVHGPVAVGECIVCHNPHESNFPGLLMAAGNDACFTCHTDTRDAFEGKKFVHMPVAADCVSCHDPHAGNYEYILKADGSRDLCFRCHTDIKEWTNNAKVKHSGGLDTDRRCLACHDPHVSNYVSLQVKAPMDTCLMCHDKTVVCTRGGTLIDIGDHLAENKIHHGPIRQKDCSGCHNAHGSDYFRILREYFPARFYAPFDPKNYEFCFMCHSETLVTEKRTTTLTGFRDGDLNLHYVHVNMPKGRTCRACHDAHATNNPHHIRDHVPFGAWQLPIGFQKKPDGGTCFSGCHREFPYNRVTPYGYNR